jgi:large subunit ribosomal protein L28
VRVTAATLRTVDFKGGLDSFLMNTKNQKLTEKAKKIKRALIKKAAEADAA